MSEVNSMFGMNLDKASFIAKQTREARRVMDLEQEDDES